LLDMPGSGPTSLADSRVRAVLLLSGQGRGQMGLTQKSWEKFSLPMLNVTGSLDRGAGGQDPAWRKDPFDLSPPGDKYHLFIEGAHHGSFTGRFAREGARRPGLRDRRRSGADGKEIFEWVEVATLAFWDAYLKGEPGAKAYLRTDDLERRSRGAATLDRR
ncbi:MAG: alpha/beta hydrolase family protein, partial [Planctomycetota bacterium]